MTIAPIPASTQEFVARILTSFQEQPLDNAGDGQGSLERIGDFPTDIDLGDITDRFTTYDESDLYGPNGPRSDDVEQNGIGNCYFLATIASVADQDPGHIYDSITFNPETGNFTVTLYEKGPFGIPIPLQVEVTQADLRDNIARGGGAWPDGPLWPAVMEAAYAKQHLQNAPLYDGQPDPRIDGGYGPGTADKIGEDGKPVRKLDANGDPIPILDENGDPAVGDDGEPLFEFEQVDVGGMGDGGLTSDAAFTVTGEGHRSIQAPSGEGMLGPVQTHLTGLRLESALASGSTVTVSVANERPGQELDGLQGGHAYTVNRVYQDANGVWQVELRNPWGHNGSDGNGNGLEGIGDGGAIITVPLDSIHTEGYQGFVISPKSRQ